MHRYKNDGRYVLGVPARDLSDDEWDALTEAEQAAASDVYDHQAKATPAIKPTETTPEARRGGN